MNLTVKSFTVLYFAALREQAGCDSETVFSAAATPAELYAELRSRHAFDLNPTQLRPAVNHAFCDWQQPLNHGDTVAFIPPVSGG
ncbi:molybdopterin converting factor subunit 1 [Conchiformibius steedae]|uniref:molybdopterin converting factor subunit 1 n=1 Tax=Conchiformibius steedae TaxID=153493 RepID=UPI0026F0BA31|nr:molybdopterin converting factor subunit 1 [Conchiformibius steedae]